MSEPQAPLAHEPDEGLRFVDHLRARRHVLVIEFGEQRVAQAMNGAHAKVVHAWIRHTNAAALPGRN